MKKAMKEECTHLHCIHFIVFCAVTCNGSSVILEIMRRASETFGLHESNEILHDDTYGILKANDLYSTLFEVSQSELFMATGSCNYPRHTYSSKNVPFVTRSDMEKSENAMTQVTQIIEKYSQDIRSLNQTNCQTKIHSMQEELETVSGIGPFNVHHVIHLSAFLGLLPLKALQYASLLPTKSSSSNGTIQDRERLRVAELNIPGTMVKGSTLLRLTIVASMKARIGIGKVSSHRRNKIVEFSLFLDEIILC